MYAFFKTIVVMQYSKIPDPRAFYFKLAKFYLAEDLNLCPTN
jgi:hypothetical protein